MRFQVVSIESGEEQWRNLHKKTSTIADGLPLEGKALNLNEQSLAVVLPKPVMADFDHVQIILTSDNGSPVNLTGRVVRQQQTMTGEVIVGIELGELSSEATTSLIRKCHPPSPFTMKGGPTQYPEADGWRGWTQALLGRPSIPHTDRRRIPRLPTHTTCAILRQEVR